MSQSEELQQKLFDMQREHEEASLKCFGLKKEYEEQSLYAYGLEKQLQELKNKLADVTPIPDEEEVDTTTDSDSNAASNRGLRRFYNDCVTRVEDSSILSHITLIIARPQYGSNVGQIARTAANLGITDIRLVNPITNPLGSDARRYSVNALPVLSSLPVYATTDEAAADCNLIIGTSGKNPSLSGMEWIVPAQIIDLALELGLWDGVSPPQYTHDDHEGDNTTDQDTPAVDGDNDDEQEPPKSKQDATRQILQSYAKMQAYMAEHPESAPPESDNYGIMSHRIDRFSLEAIQAGMRSRPLAAFKSASPRIAIMFGNEADGMTTAELRPASHCITIPTRGPFNSLNLSHAVTAVLYSIQVAGDAVQKQIHADSVQQAQDAAATPSDDVCEQQEQGKEEQPTTGEGDQQHVHLKPIQHNPAPRARPLPPSSHKTIAALREFLSVFVHQVGYRRGNNDDTLDHLTRGFQKMTAGQVKILFGFLRHIQKVMSSSPGLLLESPK